MPNAPKTPADGRAGRLRACAAVLLVALALVAAEVTFAADAAAALPGRATAAAGRPGKKAAKKAAKKASTKAARTSAKSSAKAAKRAAAKRAATKRATVRSAKRSRRGEQRSAGRSSARRGRASARPAPPTERADGAGVAAAVARVVIPTVTLAPAASAPRAPATYATGAAGAAPSPDTLAGRSGKLRARWALPSATGLFAYLRGFFGDSAAAPGAHTPGVYRAGPEADGVPRPFTYIAMLPFGEKVDGRIGGYRMGFWPGESRRAEGASSREGRYAPPAGFIQVTADNAETPVSEHFRLRDFLTHDQARVWPKYLALDAALVDKLELVLDDLRARGYHARRLHVMSGFRTPQYNRGGGDTRGRAEQSRHQYGDAADVWVENGDGAMADLTGDGRVDVRDAAVLAESVERVEARHPALVGGVGVYHGTRAHGPFVHIDTRGSRARWGAG